MKALFTSLIASSALITSTAHSQSQREVERVIEKAGFVPLQPPQVIENSGKAPNLTWRPGYVFRIVNFDRGRKGIRTVCSNFFAKDFSRPAGWLTPDRDATKKGSFGIAASLLAPSGSLTKGSAGLKFDWDKHTVVKFEELTKLEVSDEDVGAAIEPSENVEAPLSKNCEKALRKLRNPDKRFSEKIYFVTDTAISPKFSVNVDRTSGTDVGLEVDFKKLVTIKPGYKNTEVSKESIVHSNPNAPAVLGYRALLLDKVLIKAGAVGVGAVRASISSVVPSETELTELKNAEVITQ